VSAATQADDAAQGFVAATRYDRAMRFAAPVPILRMFDLDRAKEFYVGFLGFQVDWEHRFEPVAPVYMQVSRGDCRIHSRPSRFVRLLTRSDSAFRARSSSSAFSNAALAAPASSRRWFVSPSIS